MTGLDPFTWAIVLLLLGCALVVLEVFVPSGGILGMLSGLAILGSILFAFRRDMTSGMVFVLISLVAVPSVLMLGFSSLAPYAHGQSFSRRAPQWRGTQAHRSSATACRACGHCEVQNAPIRIGSGRWTVARFASPKEMRSNPEKPWWWSKFGVIESWYDSADPDEAEHVITADSADVLSKPLDELGLEGFADEPLG